MVARLGGDEFAVLLPVGPHDGRAAREVAARLRAALAEPIRLEGMSFEIEASVGIALYPDDADRRRAAAAARRRGHVPGQGAAAAGSSATWPTPTATPRPGWPCSATCAGASTAASSSCTTSPRSYLADRRTAGVEALVRWQHPARGLIAPDEFIPLAEQSYLMRDLTAHVVRTGAAPGGGVVAGRACRCRSRSTCPPATCSTAGSPTSIGRELGRARPAAEALLLEIDERVLTSEPADAAADRVTDAGGARRAAQPGRLRHRLLVAGAAQAAAGQRGQDRLVVRRPAACSSADDQVIVQSDRRPGRARSASGRSPRAWRPRRSAAALLAMGCDAAQGWHFSQPLNAAVGHRVAGRATWPPVPATSRAGRPRRPRPARGHAATPVTVWPPGPGRHPGH